MTRIRLICLSAITAMLVAPAINAQFQPPKPGPEHAVLKKLEGTWDTTMKMGPMESKGTATYKMDLGGLWLVSQFEGSFGGMKFSGRGYDSYDADRKKYVGVRFDSMTTTPMVMAGTYDAAAKTMTMVGEAPGMDKKIVKHKAVSKMVDDNTMQFGMYVGDAKEPAFTILYKRRK